MEVRVFLKGVESPFILNKEIGNQFFTEFDEEWNEFITVEDEFGVFVIRRDEIAAINITKIQEETN